MTKRPKADSEKDPAAVALGRKGGKAKTTKPKGLAALPPDERKRAAAHAANVRWERYHVEKEKKQQAAEKRSKAKKDD